MARHRVRIIDGASLLLVMLAVIYYCFEVEVFTQLPHENLHARAIDLDETLLISAVFCGGLVVYAMRRLAEQKRETARRIQAEQEIRSLAFHDALTGLANRRQFDEALKEAIHSPPRAGASHVVLLLDLNGFKRINDVFGHAVGDEVLIRVAGQLAQCVREGDLVARFGGDEFAILSTHVAGAEAATGLALRVIESLEPAIAAGGCKHAVGVGIGIALAPQDGVEPIDLLRKADIALYRAKARGRSALCFFEQEMDVHVRERHQIEQELLTALETGAVIPYYQPLIDLKTKKVRGCEALARWNRSLLQSMGPERFIPIAEDSGLIGPLTDYLLERACRDAVSWPPDVALSFNVSPVLLRDSGFPVRVLSVLARTGMAPTRLELEITESAMVRDLGAAQAILGTLREAGVRIALDDFGTGYSSLYHLRNFKVNRLKIDRSFIESMATDRDSAAIVRALVGLGEGLGLEVTAEGVETQEQARLLEEQGCGQVQGFLYSEAVSGLDVLAMLSRTAWAG